MAAPNKKPVGRPRKPQVKKDEVEKAREDTETEMKEKKKTEYVEGPRDSATKRMPFFNATSLKFVDISHEEFRQYLFLNGAKIEIQLPLKLGIDKNNIHRVFDYTGLSYYIPPNWIAVVTKPKPGGPDIIM